MTTKNNTALEICGHIHSDLVLYILKSTVLAAYIHAKYTLTQNY